MLTTYKAHNVFYLRISQNAVLALSLHLDPRHTMWMNDGILERVLNALRTRIATKLRQESGTDKRAKVDVYRGAGYQMAYFFRRTSQRHAVLLKDRRLVAPEDKFAPPSKRRKPDVTTNEEYVKAEEEDGSGTASVLASTSSMRPIQIEDEDEKPEEVKPTLRVKYTGFSIFGRTLIVIVEPWPALPEAMLTPAPDDRAEVRQLSATPAPSTSRARSIRSMSSATPAPQLSARGLFRAETPASEAEAANDDDEGIDDFRARSQSVIGGMEVDDDEDELPPVDFGGSTGPTSSLLSRAGSGDRGVVAAPKTLDMSQFVERRSGGG